MASRCPALPTAETLCRDLLVSEHRKLQRIVLSSGLCGSNTDRARLLLTLLQVAFSWGLRPSPASTRAQGLMLSSVAIMRLSLGFRNQQPASVARLSMARKVLMGTSSVPCVFLSLVAHNQPPLSPLPVLSHSVFNLPPLLELPLCLFNYASSFIGVSY